MNVKEFRSTYLYEVAESEEIAASDLVIEIDSLQTEMLVESFAEKVNLIGNIEMQKYLIRLELV